MGREVTVETGALERRLAHYVQEVLGENRSIVLGERLSGGWSVDTFRVRLGEDDLVLRIADSEHPLDTSPAREARMFRAAGAVGLPVPEVLAAEDDPAWLGGPFALSTFVPGQAPNVWSARRMDALLATTSAEALVARMAEIALRIQEIPVEHTAEPPSILGMRAEEYTVAADVEHWNRRLGELTVTRPVLSVGGRWLAENAPPTEAVVLQHHDFRLGNVLFGAAGRATAVLDWEFSGAGDPLCDIGYAAQPYTLGRLLRAQSRLRLEPDPTTATLQAYAEACSAPPDPERMRYFVVLGIFKMAVALAITADEWWRGQSGRRDAWLELPILSLSDDLVTAIREMR